MLVKNQHSNYNCYRGEWEDKDSRIRVHYHTFPGSAGELEIHQLIISATGIGTAVLFSSEGYPLPCDFEEE